VGIIFLGVWREELRSPSPWSLWRLNFVDFFFCVCEDGSLCRACVVSSLKPLVLFSFFFFCKVTYSEYVQFVLDVTKYLGVLLKLLIHCPRCWFFVIGTKEKPSIDTRGNNNENPVVKENRIPKRDRVRDKRLWFSRIRQLDGCQWHPSCQNRLQSCDQLESLGLLARTL